jgi:geranylgeranyl diphosphate synthase type II
MISKNVLNPLEARFVAEGFRSLLPAGCEVESHLGGVIHDTLNHPGSLLRAQLAYSILERNGVEARAALSVAVAIEYFHTASLLFDDMPAMDDARERRGHPCPHVVHGEAATVLGALAFVNRGYGLLWEVFADLDAERGRQATQLVASCLGIDGVLNGQARDLHFAEGQQRVEDVLAIAQGKTVALVRLTLVLPAIVAGLDEKATERLECLARVWGLAYQILDDFKDCLMSHEETGKSTHRDAALGRPNLPAAAGIDPAMARLVALLDEGRETVAAFTGGRWLQLAHLQAVLDGEQQQVLMRLSVAA